MSDTSSFASAVGVTALTPLYAKANGAELVPDAGFADPLAAEILDRIDPDMEQVLTDRVTVVGTIHRSLAFDEAVLAFTSANPGAQVVSLGVGLCTRHDRLANRVPEATTWIGVDTEDVVDIRRSVLPDDPTILVVGTITEPWWADAIDGTRPTIMVVEGVFMYLDQPGVNAVLTTVRDRFGPGAELVGDYFHPRIARSNRHPITKATGARYASGARNGRELAGFVDGFELVGEYPVMERVDAKARLVARLFRTLTRGQRIYAVAHLRVAVNPRARS